MADFLDTSASVDNSGGDGDRKGKRRSFGSPSGKQQSPFKKQTIRRAVGVCLKVNPKKNGSVSVLFPQAAESPREDVKLIMVDDATPNPLSLGGCPKFPVNFVTQQRLQCQIRCNRDLSLQQSTQRQISTPT